MIFWDTSAIVPLLVEEPSSAARMTLLRQDPDGLLWWATDVECLSALCRRRREQKIDSEGFQQALNALQIIKEAWSEISPSEQIRTTASRLLRKHPLRAGDAFQLAAAMAASADRPEELPLVCADDRLAEAAQLEGFSVIG